MKSTSDELKKLRIVSENYLKKTEKLDKVLAHIEASLTRVEARHVYNKKHN